MKKEFHDLKIQDNQIYLDDMPIKGVISYNINQNEAVIAEITIKIAINGNLVLQA